MTALSCAGALRAVTMVTWTRRRQPGSFRCFSSLRTWVTIRRQDTDRHGDVVTALLDGCEATVKQPRTADGHTWLMPRNPACDPIPAWQATTLGKSPPSYAALQRAGRQRRCCRFGLFGEPQEVHRECLVIRGPASVRVPGSRGPADARPRPAGRSRPGRAGPVGGTDPRARRGPVPVRLAPASTPFGMAGPGLAPSGRSPAASRSRS
ncbi:LexA family protein [Kitasatospora indigofera]|uniref:LexA family protein n=1 Tax=Kitasatospora indigofera TaxID=67307 RepID=UPI0035715B5F